MTLDRAAARKRVKEARAYLGEDHERGCEGRNYTCTCGHLERTDALMMALADDLTAALDALEKYEPEQDDTPLTEVVRQLRQITIDNGVDWGPDPIGDIIRERHGEPSDEAVEAMARAFAAHGFKQRFLVLTDDDWLKLRVGCMAGMRAALAVLSGGTMHLTEQSTPPTLTERDRPAEIEITVEMARVGERLMRAAWDDDNTLFDGMSANEAAQVIFRAMLAAGGFEVSQEIVKIPPNRPQFTERQRRLLGSQASPLPPDAAPVDPASDD